MRRTWLAAALLGFMAVLRPAVPATQTSAPSAANRTITAVTGIKVGHHTLTERPTGCTVVLADGDAVGGVSQRGGAPGTRETDLLDPANMVDKVNAVVLSGGSAFGLDAASGTVRWLEERGVGWRTGAGPVPIVVGAILFDLGVGGNPKVRPDADCGYRAAQAASDRPVEEGSVGAGAGATVGKMRGSQHAMKGGLGSSAIALPNGLVVAALAAVNAAGDIIDPATGQVVAGTRTADGKGFADIRLLLRQGDEARPPEPLQNTTLGIVATNAALTKLQAAHMAQMAQDGLSRAVVPAHTSVDGDTVFAMATGRREGPADADLIGALAADQMAQAIVRAVRAATSIPGYPAARDLR